MLYTSNLEEIIFHRHEIHRSDEFIVLSGYLGPTPIGRLENLPFPSKVIYGMYGSEGIKPGLHSSLLELQNNVESLNIFYSTLPVHSKCYVWRLNHKIVHALVGSANFSTNGLTTPFREVLAEITYDTFDPLNQYIQTILNNSISCLEADIRRIVEPSFVPEECFLSLLGRNNEVQNVAGLNWGQNPKNHTRLNDAYIKITIQNIHDYPQLFPPKQINIPKTNHRGRSNRHNDSIEIIWDDGVVMKGLLEGSQRINDIPYPKQISSCPVKSELGEYIRQRIGVPLGQPVTRRHLENYGRWDIAVSLFGEGVYSFDFSV